MVSKRLRLGVAALVIGVLVVAGIVIIRARQNGTPRETIRTARVRRGSVTASVSGTGVLQPLTTVEVKSNVGGQVVELMVDEGDRVRAGQVIARVDASDSETALEQMRADLTSASSKVVQAEQSRQMQREQTSASIRSATQAVENARVRLAQAQQQAALQSRLTESSIQQVTQAYEAARARLAQAEEAARVQPSLTETAVQQARASLAAAKASFEQTKTALAPQKLAAAKSAYDQAKATYDLTERDLERQRQLLAKGYVSRSDVDTAEQRSEVARAQLEAARNKQDTVTAEAEQDLSAAQAKVAQAQAALNSAEANRVQDALKQQDAAAARAALKQAEAALGTAQANRAQDELKQQDVEATRASLKQAQAALASAQAAARQEAVNTEAVRQAKSQVERTKASVQSAETQLRYTTIVAPRDGVVVKKYVDVGSIITAGRSAFSGTGAGVTIVDIADVSRMFAAVNVDETDIAQIAVGQAVDIAVEAYPDELFEGKVTKIAPQAVVEQNVTTVPVTVQLSWTDPRLKPELNVTCDFITKRKQDVLLVPNEAVKETDNGTVVTVIEAGKRVSRPVTVGLAGNDVTEIVSGLREGETVVTAVISLSPTGTSNTSEQGGTRRRGMGPMF